MDYAQTIDFLFNSLPLYERVGAIAYKANLDNTNKLDEHLSFPHRTFKTIHVAGTNGKGSVSNIIYNMLREAGYKAGLYTSPHITDFRERIEVGGERITEQAIIDFVENNRDIIDMLKPSFFEMNVAMALDYFREQEVDVAVIEVGMGGRLDSTNIIKPILSVITNISKDHTQFLGSTHDVIAREKAGIIKNNTPVVIGNSSSETRAIFEAIAKQHNAPITFAEDNYSISLKNNGEYDVQDKNRHKKLTLKLAMKGDYQRLNLYTVLSCFDTLQDTFQLEPYHIYNALAKTKLKGRWQILNTSPLTICDNAHNIDGISMVVKQIEKQQYDKLYFILGVCQDKDIDSILERLPANAYYIFTQSSVPRAMPVADLYSVALSKGLKGEQSDSVSSAYQCALMLATNKDMIFIGGSIFVIADLLEHIKQNLN